MYDKFAELLASSGMRVADVCRGTGLSSTMFSEWKKGKSQPKMDKIQKIADFFDVPLEYFTAGETADAPYPTTPSLSPQEWDLIRLFRTVPTDKQTLATNLVQAVFSCIS